jgi:poly(A) polymerase
MVPEPPRGALALRHFLHDSAELWPTAAVWLGARAARSGQGAEWRRWLAELIELVERDGQMLLDPPVLVRGEEVQALLGLSSGPEIGRALARVRKAQIEGRVRSREDALALLRGPA